MEAKDILSAVKDAHKAWEGSAKDLREHWEKSDAELKSVGQTSKETAKKVAELELATFEKQKELDARLEKLSEIEAAQERIDALEKKLAKGGGPGWNESGIISVGKQFADQVLGAAMEHASRNKGRIGNQWMGVKSLLPHGTKALLSSDADRLVVPDRAPLVGPVIRRFTLRDLIPVRPTMSNAIEYVRERGFYDATSTIAVGSAAISSGVATINTSAAHGLKAGDRVLIAGVTDVTGLNGWHYVASITDSDTFTVTTTEGDDVALTGTITVTLGAQQGAAGTVSEGSAKPQVTWSPELVTAAVRVVAHYIKVSRQVLDDEPQLEAYIEQRLLSGLQYEEENQILNGSGSAPDLTGILNTTGIQTQAMGSDEQLDAIIKGMVLAYEEDYAPSGIVVNPKDWYHDIVLERENGTAPQPYIHGSPIGRGLERMVDGVPVVVTNSIAEGTALVGDFARAAMLFDREQANVRMTDTDQDDFVKNLITLLAEQRVALAVFRPGAFVKVTGL